MLELGRRIKAISQNEDRPSGHGDDGRSDDEQQPSQRSREQADERLNLVQGLDVVESPVPGHPMPLLRGPQLTPGLLAVPEWRQQRPLESRSPVSPIVPYPNAWRKRCFRVLKVQLAGRGLCGLMRG